MLFRSSEWDALEVPVSDSQLNILKMIRDGYQNPHINYNPTFSLRSFMKIDEKSKKNEKNENFSKNNKNKQNKSVNRILNYEKEYGLFEDSVWSGFKKNVLKSIWQFLLCIVKGIFLIGIHVPTFSIFVRLFVRNLYAI